MATIESATRFRVAEYMGPLSAGATPLVLMQLKPRLGITPGELRPVERIKDLDVAQDERRRRT